ncbi:MAG: ribosome recycling factor [Pseudomonadota bacterium]
MSKAQLMNDLKTRMESTMKVLDNELKGLRTGRASVNLLDPVVVEAYGSKMPLSQVATVSTPDARMISVQVWDKAMVKAVEKAITEANLGLNPSSEGQVIRLPIPALSEERRKDMVKLAHKYGENTKIAIRNIRRDGMETLKKMEKDNEIAKDEHHSLSEDIQKLTDDFTGKIDTTAKQKEQEIMTM